MNIDGNGSCLNVNFYLIISVFPQVSKIILPNNLRYLENMLVSDVKAVKMMQQLDPNSPRDDRNWPMLLAKYKASYKNSPRYYKGSWSANG